jgi:hypothetical protein
MVSVTGPPGRTQVDQAAKHITIGSRDERDLEPAAAGQLDVHEWRAAPVADDLGPPSASASSAWSAMSFSTQPEDSVPVRDPRRRSTAMIAPTGL